MRQSNSTFDWLGERGWLVLCAMLVIVGGAYGFIKLASEVKEGETQRIDERVIRSMRRDTPGGEVPIGPRWLPEIGRDITALGSMSVLAIVTVIVTGNLLMLRKTNAAVLLVVATVGGALLGSLLKHTYARPRPTAVAHLTEVYSSSFPSGHSMMSAVVYLTLGSLLMRLAPRRRLKLYYLLVAMILTLLVGLSRIYMGVHYPSDVLAGWTAGLVWALIVWLVARWLQKRGAIERDSAARITGLSK